MNAVVFSWSGSFRDNFEEREEAITSFVAAMHDRGMEIGIVTDDEIGDVENVIETDFEIPHVDDLSNVLGALTTKYDKVFFVSDIPAELATANRSGAFTVGRVSDEHGATDLSGVGPNYVVEALDELEDIMRIEALDQ